MYKKTRKNFICHRSPLNPPLGDWGKNVKKCITLLHCNMA